MQSTYGMLIRNLDTLYFTFFVCVYLGKSSSPKVTSYIPLIIPMYPFEIVSLLILSRSLQSTAHSIVHSPILFSK